MWTLGKVNSAKRIGDPEHLAGNSCVLSECRAQAETEL